MFSLKNKLLFLVLLIAAACSWLLINNSPGQHKPVKINHKFYGLKNRTYKSITFVDSIKLSAECGSLAFHNGILFLNPYDPETESTQFYTYYHDSLIKQNLDEGLTCSKIITGSNSLFFLMFKENNTIFKKPSVCIYHYRSDKNYQKYECDNVKNAFTSTLDDSCFYFITNNAAKSTYLYRYNYFEKAKTDSLDLNRVFKDPNPELGFVLGGTLVCKNNTIVYASMYSGEGLAVNKHNLSSFVRIKTIDSLPLPKFVEDKVSEDMTQFRLDPEIFTSWQLKNFRKNYAVLSWLDYNKITRTSKEENSFIDIYTPDFLYSYSYKFPLLNKKYAAYSFEADTAQNILYVLYSDFLTIRKFKLHD